MDLSAEKIEAIYREVCRECNDTEFSKTSGYAHEYSAFTLRQLELIAASLPAKDGVLVDIGTGMGVGPRFARKTGARAISIDFDAGGVSPALEAVKDAGVEGIFLDVLSAPLPFADNSVDCILFADVIEHLPHSPKRVLEECLRVLKPGGACIATTPNAVRIAVRLKVFLGFSNWPHVADYFEAGYHYGHHHEYTADEFRYVFEHSGFKIDRLEMIEQFLNEKGVVNFATLQSRDRSGARAARQSGGGISLAKGVLRVASAIVPSWRSVMLVQARKPADWGGRRP